MLKPRFLCYVTGDGTTEAQIVESPDAILAFIEREWVGTPPDEDADEWAEVIEEVLAEPSTWGDGTRRLRYDFEGGYLTVELLGC